MNRTIAALALALGAGLALSPPVLASQEKAPEFQPFEAVSKGLTEVPGPADGTKGFYRLWKNDKEARLLAELPAGHDKQLVLLATTVGSGNEDAGVMGGSVYAHWKRRGKRLMLVEPEYLVRTTGDAQSRASVNELFTERVLLDVPILTMGPGGGPVIDLKHLMVDQHAKFFGLTSDGWGPRIMGARTHLAKPLLPARGHI